MKEGRKVIVPTTRQMEQMARKQAEANQITDEQGRTGMANTIDDIEGIKEYIKQLGLSKQEQKDILENGLATDNFLNLNVLRILMALKDGKTKNEMEDPNFKFSLEKLIKKWANSEVELIAAYDKNGMFLGYATQADPKLVRHNIGDGQIIGGTTIHTHPSSPDRFFGGNFSVGDYKSFVAAGEKKMVVTSKEGTYILERSGKLNLTNKQIVANYAKTLVRVTLSQQKIKSDTITKFGCTKTDLAQWRDRHEGAKELASSAGLKYTFIPNKGFEGLAK